MTKKMFFVVGCGRSGTTLLGSMLDSHPDLTCEIEKYQRDYLYLTNFPRDMSVPYVQAKVDAFKERCSVDAARATTKLWGNKITANSFYGLTVPPNLASKEPVANPLAYFFDVAFADVKVIFIVRDAHANIQSMMNRGGRTPIQACRFYERAIQLWQFLARRDNTLLVKFEDLILEPQETLTKCADFLGVEYHGAMMQGCANAKNYYRQGSIDKTVLAKTYTFPAWIKEAVAPYQRMFNYPEK